MNWVIADNSKLSDTLNHRKLKNVGKQIHTAFICQRFFSTM